MKKELKKHKAVDTDENDLRKMARKVFRKQPIDMILGDSDGKGVKIENLEISPEFAAISERILRHCSPDKKERLKKMLEITDVWVPPSPSLDEQDDYKKKVTSFTDDKKDKEPKKKEPKKKTTKVKKETKPKKEPKVKKEPKKKEQKKKI